MADLKIMFVAVAATLLMCQLASARPDGQAAEEGLSLKNVEASVSIAVDDVKKNFEDLASKTQKYLADLRNATQSPEAQNMLNSLNEQLAKLATNVKDAAKDLSSRIQSSMPSAPASS